jgi:hypothetical protein
MYRNKDSVVSCVDQFSHRYHPKAVYMHLTNSGILMKKARPTGIRIPKVNPRMPPIGGLLDD